MTTLTGKETLITDDNFHQFIDPVVNGETKRRGLIPRNYETHPVGCYASGPAMHAIPDFPLIPRDQWIDRIKEQDANKSSLIHLRRNQGPNGGPIPALDQDGYGYCWCHSGTMGNMMARAMMGLPYVRLSAFMVGSLVKSYRDEGGWGAQGLDFIIANGVPSVEFWPEKSSNRSNDNAAMRANAALHKVVETWMDLQAPQYDRNLTEDQAVTALLLNCPVIGDFNWWSHSIILLQVLLAGSSQLMKLPKNLNNLDFRIPNDAKLFGDAFPKKLLNSWTDGWGDMGEGTLTGSKAILDGGAAIRTSIASVV